jgi:hypothetical protein
MLRPVVLNDTHPTIEARLIEGYRAMTASDKLARVVSLSRAVRALALANVKCTHPNASERELTLRLASRTLTPDLLRRAVGWDVDVEGF